jgi:hypothetical protein
VYRRPIPAKALEQPRHVGLDRIVLVRRFQRRLWLRRVGNDRRDEIWLRRFRLYLWLNLRLDWFRFHGAFGGIRLPALPPKARLNQPREQGIKAIGIMSVPTLLFGAG